MNIILTKEHVGITKSFKIKNIKNVKSLFIN